MECKHVGHSSTQKYTWACYMAATPVQKEILFIKYVY